MDDIEIFERVNEYYSIDNIYGTDVLEYSGGADIDTSIEIASIYDDVIFADISRKLTKTPVSNLLMDILERYKHDRTMFNIQKDDDIMFTSSESAILRDKIYSDIPVKKGGSYVPEDQDAEQDDQADQDAEQDDQADQDAEQDDQADQDGMYEELRPEQDDQADQDGMYEELRPEQDDQADQDGMYEELPPEQDDQADQDGMYEELQLEQDDQVDQALFKIIKELSDIIDKQ